MIKKNFLQRYREAINPPYKIGDFTSIFLTLLLLVAIPLTVFATYQRFVFRAKAATPDEIKTKIIELVGNQQTPEAIPNSGYDSFGKFLWGLSGCETGHNDQTIGYVHGEPTFYGLFQFTPTTWEAVHTEMGIPTRDIYDGLAQVETIVYMIQTHYNGGFSNWPGCTNGVDVSGDREWFTPTNLEGWPYASVPTPNPTPAVPGNIKGVKSGNDPGVASMSVWLDAGSPSTTNSTFSFDNLTAGKHKIHVSLNPGNPLLAQTKYTLCTSALIDCGAAGDPRQYHYLNNLKSPTIYSSSEAYIEVSIPSGGFVDIHWLYPPLGLPPCSATAKGSDFTLVRKAQAADCDPTLTPPPPPPPTVQNVENTPACADTNYGGDRNFNGPPNIKMPFIVSNATSAQIEGYENGIQFFNYTWTALNPPSAYELWGNAWSLGPNKTYSWRVRTGNSGGWSNWVGGYAWNVPSCPHPDLTATIQNPPCPFAAGAAQPPYICNKGLSVTFQGAINNQSPVLGTGVGFTIKWYMNDSVVKSVSHAALSAGVTESAGHDTYNYTFTNPGDYTMKLCADDPSVVTETSETNNCGSVWIRVPVQNTDIYIGGCSESPGNLANCLNDQKGIRKTSYYPGEKVTIKLQLLGTQEVPASNFWVETWTDSSFDTSNYCNKPGSAGSKFITTISNPVSLTFRAPATTGTHRFVVIADTRGSNPTCAIPEISEENNFNGLHEFIVLSAPASSADTDGDGFTNGAEVSIGTDPYDPCGTDAWPLDFVSGGIPDSTNRINVLDGTSFLAPIRRLNTSPGNSAYDKRWDLNPGPGVFTNWINVTDYTALTVGITGFPPMFGGTTKAFNGPACPWPVDP